MTSNDIQHRWERLDELFHAAIALPADEVDDFCRVASDGDEQLCSFLRELVTSASVADERIRSSIADLAGEVASEELLIGERVGAYHIDALLARGGMGDVYLASRADGEFQKNVVVKLIRKKLNRAEFVRNFRTERQVLANLSHPSIPALIDAGQLADGRPYLVCDYIDGVPLDRFCDSNGLTHNQRLALLERVARAVQHAHNNLVLHLDIKPDNILVEDDGTPRLLDFGVARLLDDEQAGHEALTPEYASPEQLRGEATSVGSDVYSMGMLLYRLLAGQAPFDSPKFAPSPTKIAERHSFAETARDRMQLAGLSPDLRAIVRRATALEPSQRYPSIEALSRDLRNCRLGRPVAARDGTIVYRWGRYVRRHPVAVTAVLGVFMAVLGFAFRENALRQQAQAAYRLAEQEAETARQVSVFLSGLFRVSDPDRARGNTVTARELLDSGAARIRDELSGRPLVQSRLMGVMGEVFMELGLHEEADKLLVDALAIREAALSDDDVELGKLLTTLGVLYLRRGRFPDAERVLFRGREIYRSVLGPEHELVANNLNFVGVLETYQNNFDAAESALKEAIALYERLHGPGYESLAESSSNLASVYYRLGRFDESRVLHERAIAIGEKNWGPDHPMVAIRLDNLGNVHHAAGRIDAAIAAQQRSLEIRENNLSPKHPMIAMNLDNLASSYASSGEFAQAEALRLRALAIREEVLDPLHPHIASNLGNLGELYSRMGRLDEAEAYLLRSNAIKRQVYKPDNPSVGVGLVNLGEVYRKQGNLDDAEEQLLAGIAVFRQNLSDDHLYRMHSDWLLANVYRDAGRLDEARGLYERVLPFWRERSAEDIDRARVLRDYETFLRAGGAAIGAAPPAVLPAAVQQHVDAIGADDGNSPEPR